MARDHIRFLLNDEYVSLSGFDPTRTVLEWLREDRRLVGTKEGCNEGDCGACTVVVVRPDGQGLRYRAVNACIQLLGTLDGCQLLTVEHLKQHGALHPVQQAMVDCHGSQCGFCTPGFVMSLFALLHTRPEPPTEDEVDVALAGNLCRCTGYAPIARAAQAMYATCHGDRFATEATETQAGLLALRDDDAVEVASAHGRFFAPATADQLAEILLAHPAATIVAGCTDVGLWITKQLRRPDPIVWIGRVVELQRIKRLPDGGLRIGAGVAYTDAAPALAALYPDMGELMRRLGSVQVRNLGTVGGNVANGSPIGDSPPALIAAGATLHLRYGAASRSLPLEDFFLAYGKQDRAPGEFVEAITVPAPPPGTRFRAYKVSKRFDQDITAVLGCFAMRIEDGRVAAVRIAYGGMAGTPQRAAAAEAALLGAPWSRATIARAQEALVQDFTPMTDMRASAAYRLRVAQNLLLRLLIETTEPGTETRLVGERSLAHA